MYVKSVREPEQWNCECKDRRQVLIDFEPLRPYIGKGDGQLILWRCTTCCASLLMQRLRQGRFLSQRHHVEWGEKISATNLKALMEKGLQKGWFMTNYAVRKKFCWFCAFARENQADSNRIFYAHFLVQILLGWWLLQNPRFLLEEKKGLALSGADFQPRALTDTWQ